MSQREKKESEARIVNSGVDNLLRLVPVPTFEHRARYHHRIRILQVGMRPEVVNDLNAWARGSGKEFNLINNGLERLAENEKVPTLKTVKHVGNKGIIQIFAGNARLWCFEDDDDYTIICTNTFWIGHGDKKKMQNLGIQRAEELMVKWREAQPVAGQKDLRIAMKEQKK